MIALTNVIFLLHKAINVELAYGLSSSEFRCKCEKMTCNQLLFSPRLKDSWNISRIKFGESLIVLSGHRCQSHNKDVGGVPDSRHVRGEAIDISHIEFDTLKKRELKKILEENFDVVIDYPTFYHCHNN
jgi:hypothetical protein